MLHGRFGDTTGRPYIEGRVVIPRLGIRGVISFLVDTGADMTVLMPLDGERLDIDYSLLINPVGTVGVGGLGTDYLEPAMVVFTDPGVSLHAYNIELHISAPSPDIANIPSLLGRNILDNREITYNKLANMLVADVLASDIAIPLGTPPPST